MITEEFSQIDSPVHRIDPRFRVVVAALFSLLVAVSLNFALLLPALGIALVLAAVARLPLVPLLQRLAVVNVFILFLWAFLPFTTPGTPVFTVWTLSVTLQGLLLAGAITIKSNTIVLTILALIGTLPVPLFGHALQRLRVPEKICQLLLFTYRYIFVIEQEYARLVRALKVRGFKARTDMHTYRTVANLFGVLLIRSFDRAERVYKAMLCRGFQGRFHTLSLLSSTPRDYGFLLIMLTLMALLAWLHFSWKVTY